MLSNEQIAEMMRETWGCASIAPRRAVGFARAIEAEVRKQDDALIRQMRNSLEKASPFVNAAHEWKSSEWIAERANAITAARARRGEKT